MFATGVIDDPPQKSVVDVVGGFEVAQKIAEQSTVLLKNDHGQLPLDASKIRSIAVIGPHADVGMISGGGSAQVDPPGGNAIMPPGKGQTRWLEKIWFPTSPLKAIRAKAPGAKVQFASGADPAAAAALAKSADVAIVFAYQWESEGMDLESLSLPEHQDELIAQGRGGEPAHHRRPRKRHCRDHALGRSGERHPRSLVRGQPTAPKPWQISFLGR